MANQKKSQRRREKGQGTVYEYPPGSGIWYAKMPPDEAGKQPKWRVKNQEEGRALLKEKLRQREAGIKVVTRQQTLEQWLEYWLEHVVKLEVKPTTHRSYRQIVRLYISPRIGKIRLDQIKPAHIRHLIATLREQVAIHTVRNAYARLRAALNIAVNDQLIERNPADLVKVPSGEKRQKQLLSAKQAQIFLAALEGHRLHPLYIVALATAMREGEIIGLRWQDIDWEKKCIKVSGQMQQFGGKMIRITPKTETSMREIPIDDELIAVLRQHQERQSKERDVLGDEWKDHGLVFPSEVGTPLGARNLVRHFQSTLKRAGLPHMRFHDLRHTAGSLMLADHATMTDVSKIMGHSSVAVTAAIYADSFEDNKRRAVGGVMRRLTEQETKGDTEE